MHVKTVHRKRELLGGRHWAAASNVSVPKAQQASSSFLRTLGRQALQSSGRGHRRSPFVYPFSRTNSGLENFIFFDPPPNAFASSIHNKQQLLLEALMITLFKQQVFEVVLCIVRRSSRAFMTT
jgi:hypothetical protein